MSDVKSSDRHVRRIGEDYKYALMDLLPQGPAWPRDFGTTLEKLCGGLTDYWGFVDHRAAELLERESDPRQTIELLPDWERAWGLPDPCLQTPQTIEDRQIALVLKMTMLGAQSRAFFYEIAETIGYTIHIGEFSPWTFGLSECGMTDDGVGRHGEPYPRWEIGPPEIRYYWTVEVGAVHFAWWRYGSAEIGRDPHCRIALATDLECIFNRYKPAHTIIIFDYSELEETALALEDETARALAA